MVAGPGFLALGIYDLVEFSDCAGDSVFADLCSLIISRAAIAIILGLFLLADAYFCIRERMKQQ